MSSKSSKFFRGTVIALLMGVAPVASAVGQEAGQPAPDQQAVTQPAAAQVAAPQAAVQPAVLQDLGRTVVENAQAIEADVREANALEAEAEALRPGQFIWRPERAERGPVEVGPPRPVAERPRLQRVRRQRVERPTRQPRPGPLPAERREADDGQPVAPPLRQPRAQFLVQR